MSPNEIFVVMVGMGIITFALRFSFFALQERVQLPPLVPKLLRYAPAAVLLGLVTPAIVMQQGSLNLTPTNERLLAAIVAILIAWRTKNVLGTIAAGMVALWLLQWLGV